MRLNSKFKVQSSKVILSIVIILVTSHFSLVTFASAQDSSPSGSLVQKLNELKNDIASKAAQLKNEVTKKVQNKAIIGTILDLSTNELTLQTPNGTKVIKYDEFTEVIGAKGKEIKIDTLEDKDNIAALGDVDDKGFLVSQRLVYLDIPATISAELIWGQIQKTSGSSITIKDKSGQSRTILTNSQTAFFLGNAEASILDAKVEKYLAARATKQKDNTLRARFIYFIPSAGFTKPSEQKSTINTNSATPSASKKT